MLTRIASLDRHYYQCVVRQGKAQGLHPLALRLSWSGNGPFYLYITVLCLLLDKQGESLLNMLVSAYLIELPLYFILKNMVRRQRPCHALADGVASFEPADKFSLPSGHTAAAFVMAGSIYCIYPAYFCLAALWAIGIGMSRIVLGVHYPLDIVAGAILGIVSVLLCQPLL